MFSAIEEAKNNMRFADITVMPITKTETLNLSMRNLNQRTFMIVFGQVYIDQCVSKAKALLPTPLSATWQI